MNVAFNPLGVTIEVERAAKIARKVNWGISELATPFVVGLPF